MSLPRDALRVELESRLQSAAEAPLPPSPLNLLLLDIVPSSIRFLFEDGGPFKVTAPRFDELKERLAAIIPPIDGSQESTRKPPAGKKSVATPTGLAGLFHDAGLRLEIRCPESMLIETGRKNDPGALLAEFVEKIKTLDTLISVFHKVAKGDVLLTARMRARLELVEQFKQWNTKPITPDPLEAAIINLRSLIREQTAREMQPSTVFIPADQLTSFVRPLFEANDRSSKLPFKLTQRAGAAESTIAQAECIRQFNKSIEDYFNGKNETVTAKEAIGKGWKLVSDYKGEGESVPLDDVFFSAILPELRKLYQKLKALERLETPLSQSKSVVSQPTQSSDYRDTILQSAFLKIEDALPTMLTLLAEVVHPIQASLDAVSKRIDLIARRKAIEVEAESLRQEAEADERNVIDGAAAKRSSVTMQPALFATTASVGGMLHPSPQFPVCEAERLYISTGFYDTYLFQRGNISDQAIVKALHDLDTAMEKFDTNRPDAETYRYDIWT